MIYIQIHLNASPDRVFEALTTNDAVQTWFAEHTDIALDEERYDFWGCYTLTAPSQAQGHHPILILEPNKRLRFQWMLFDKETIVTFRLHDRGNSTILSLKHTEIDRGYEDFWFVTLENLRRYLDGRPVDARLDFTGTLQGNIQHELIVDAPPETVFEALTQPEPLEQWIASNTTNFNSEHYDIGWGMAFKLLEVEPNHKVSYAWFGKEGETVVTWTLEGSEGKTRLTFVHSGFGATDETADLHLGWLNFINWLRAVAENGPAWHPPIVPLDDQRRSYYPARIAAQQAELIEADMAQ